MTAAEFRTQQPSRIHVEIESGDVDGITAMLQMAYPTATVLVEIYEHVRYGKPPHAAAPTIYVYTAEVPHSLQPDAGEAHDIRIEELEVEIGKLLSPLA
jgi:hypothetical protein